MYCRCLFKKKKTMGNLSSTFYFHTKKEQFVFFFILVKLSFKLRSILGYIFGIFDFFKQTCVVDNNVFENVRYKSGKFHILVDFVNKCCKYNI